MFSALSICLTFVRRFIFACIFPQLVIYRLKIQFFTVANMMYLFDLQYQLQKGMYFTDKITTHSYNIYYSKNISEKYWNYAVVSDLCPLRSVLSELKQHFSRIGRPVHIQLSVTDGENLNELQNNRFKVNCTDTWMRYEGGAHKASFTARRVEDKTDQENYIKVFSEYFRSPNPYMAKISPEILSGLRRSVDNNNLTHFISYDGKHPAAVATVGCFDNYALLFNVAVASGYAETEHPAAIINACTEYCRQSGCVSLNVNLLSSCRLERWYEHNGFKRIGAGCRMIL